MISLLTSVLDAHGGMDRWERVNTITARLSIGGPFWGRKGWPDIFGAETTLEFDAHRQHIVVTPFNGVEQYSVFDVAPERVVVYTGDGIVVDRGTTPAPHSPATRSRRRGMRCRSTTSSATPVGTISPRPFFSRIPGSRPRSSSRGRSTERPGGVCTSRFRSRSQRTAKSRSSITAATSCNDGWTTRWRSTVTFSSPSISTSRRPLRGSFSPLSVASTGAAQTGSLTRARPRSRSTSQTSRSTSPDSPRQSSRHAQRGAPREPETAATRPEGHCGRRP